MLSAHAIMAFLLAQEYIKHVWWPGSSKAKNLDALTWSASTSSCKSDACESSKKSPKRDVSPTSELNRTNLNTSKYHHTNTEQNTGMCGTLLNIFYKQNHGSKITKGHLAECIMPNSPVIQQILYCIVLLLINLEKNARNQSTLHLPPSFPQISGLHQSHCPGHHRHCGSTSSNRRCRCGNSGSSSHGCGHWGGGTGSHYSK